MKVASTSSTYESWRSGTKRDCKTDWLWVRSPLEEMKYLLKFIFPFPRSGVVAKRGIMFCHSTSNASKIRQKVGNLNTRFQCQYTVPDFPSGQKIYITNHPSGD